jgi:hypothetical protein
MPPPPMPPPAIGRSHPRDRPELAQPTAGHPAPPPCATEKTAGLAAGTEKNGWTGCWQMGRTAAAGAPRAALVVHIDPHAAQLVADAVGRLEVTRHLALHPAPTTIIAHITQVRQPSGSGPLRLTVARSWR